jgi:hypothetical protein
MRIDAVRDAGGAKLSVKKSAFCDVHGPRNGDGPMAADADANSPNDPEREIFRERLRKVRKILAERRTVTPAVCVPTLPPDQVVRIASLISVPSRNSFFRRLMAYWLMKRRARNGVPLIRRLQADQKSRRSLPLPEADPVCDQRTEELGDEFGTPQKNAKRKKSPHKAGKDPKKRRKSGASAEV